MQLQTRQGCFCFFFFLQVQSLRGAVLHIVAAVAAEEVAAAALSVCEELTEGAVGMPVRLPWEAPGGHAPQAHEDTVGEEAGTTTSWCSQLKKIYSAKN